MNHDEIAGYTLRSSQELESILATKFGATGNGLIERARSVQSSIPANIFNSILYAGRVRNQFVHDGSAPADMNRYIAAFNEALAWGRNAPSRMTHGGASSTGRPSVLRLFTKWKVIRFVIAVAAALYGLFYGWTSHGVGASIVFAVIGFFAAFLITSNKALRFIGGAIILGLILVLSQWLGHIWNYK